MESERNRNSEEERSLRYLREYSIVLTQKRKLDGNQWSHKSSACERLE